MGAEKKKYTVIYSEQYLHGNYVVSATQYKRVETEDLPGLIRDKYGGNAWFVFEGWPKLEGEE